MTNNKIESVIKNSLKTKFLASHLNFLMVLSWPHSGSFLELFAGQNLAFVQVASTGPWSSLSVPLSLPEVSTMNKLPSTLRSLSSIQRTFWNWCGFFSCTTAGNFFGYSTEFSEGSPHLLAVSRNQCPVLLESNELLESDVLTTVLSQVLPISVNVILPCISENPVLSSLI